MESDASARVRSVGWQLLLLALLWTGLNCLKPVHIDDASYLKFAREFAHHPLDPYAFQLSWDQWPEPALWFTAPAVLPYWLAPAAKWFYGTPAVMKLWMFPFVWLFVASFYQLCRRFVGAHAMLLCWMTVLSGAFLPATNLMLDVPSLGLFLASLELVFRAIERNAPWLSCAAGCLAALAIETKYTTLVAPAVLFAAGYAMRRWRIGAIAAATALLALAAWESLLALKYGHSQFLVQLTVGDPRRRLSAYETIARLPAYLAAPAPFLILLALRPLGVRGWALALVSIAVAFAILLTHNRVFVALSALLAIAAAVSIRRMIRSSQRGSAERRTIDFFLAWLCIELTGACVISPFPAVRRLFGVVIVLTLLLSIIAFRHATKSARGLPWRIACGACVAVAFVFYASDLEEAFVRKQSVESAAEIIRKSDREARTWYIGHWGVEYYAERAGMQPLVPDQSLLRAGDWLVDFDGVHKQNVLLPAQMLEVIDRPLTEFHLRWSTARSYYGGIVPITWHRPISEETPVSGLQPTVLRVTHDGILPSRLPIAELVEAAMLRGDLVPEGLIRALINFKVNGTFAQAESADRALIHIGSKAMLICLRNQDPRVRLFGAEGFIRLDIGADVHDALRRAANDPDPAVRQAAARALAQ